MGTKKPDFLVADLRENLRQCGLDTCNELPRDIALFLGAHDDEGSLGRCLEADGGARCLLQSLHCDALLAEQDAMVLDIHLIALNAHGLLALGTRRAEKALGCNTLDTGAVYKRVKGCLV